MTITDYGLRWILDMGEKIGRGERVTRRWGDEEMRFEGITRP